MVRRYLIAFVAVGFSSAMAGAQTNAPLAPPPPGVVAQDVTAYLHGEAMNSRYRLVTSRVLTGHPPMHQWYLSVYAQGPDRFMRLYQSPGAHDSLRLIPRLQKAAGTNHYFPQETSVQIAGAGDLMGAGRQQAVLVVHTAAADCGTTTVSVLSADAGPGPLRVLAQVTNPCRLTAEVQAHGVLLQGPYYKPKDALCCPSNSIVSAMLRFDGRSWSVQPRFFALKTLAAPAPAVTPLTHPTPLFTPIFKAILTTPAPSGPPQPPSRS